MTSTGNDFFLCTSNNDTPINQMKTFMLSTMIDTLKSTQHNKSLPQIIVYRKINDMKILLYMFGTTMSSNKHTKILITSSNDTPKRQ